MARQRACRPEHHVVARKAVRAAEAIGIGPSQSLRPKAWLASYQVDAAEQLRRQAALVVVQADDPVHALIGLQELNHHPAVVAAKRKKLFQAHAAALDHPAHLA